MKTPQLTILGAGPPRFPGHQPSVQRLDRRRKVLDWIIQAFQALNPEICFVGGYEIENVIHAFPGLNYRINNNWQNSGAVESLLLAPMEDGRDQYICYSDILFREELVRDLAKSDCQHMAIAVDETKPALAKDKTSAFEAVIFNTAGIVEARTLSSSDVSRFSGVTVAEFIGLVRIPGGDVEKFQKFLYKHKERLARENISSLVGAWVESHGPDSVHALASEGLWTSLEDTNQLGRFILGSKARTLVNLRGKLQKSEIAPIVHFSRQQWTQSSASLITHTRDTFVDERLIVRSSAVAEDGFNNTNAGQFLSLLDVPKETDALLGAVESVLESYNGDNPDDQVLIQPMLQDVTCSGVVFTRVLSTGAPYFVINYTVGPSTDGITSGSSQEPETVYVYRGAPEDTIAAQPSFVRRLVDAAREIELLVDYDALDIEFACVGDEQIFTLQVRPLTTDAARYDRGDDSEIEELLVGVCNQLNALNTPGLEVLGSKTIWSCMTDWNPAEIIGVKPQPLAFGLYRELVTNEVWAKQRAECGYRDVRPLPLVRSFAGHTFVDIRGSLNSFVPAAVNQDTAKKIVEFCLTALADKPHLHDKVEFEVIPTCVDFAIDNWLQHLRSEAGLADHELESFVKELAAVTERIVVLSKESFERIRKLEADTERIIKASDTPLERLRRLLYHCRCDGTIAFAHLARGGFVAASWLKSSVQTGILEQSRVDEFLHSIDTVSGRLTADALKVKNGLFGWDEFLERYGHLRPGTYEITSPAYRDFSDDYLRPLVLQARPPQITGDTHEFRWEENELERISTASKRINLDVSADKALEFIRDAIVGREYGKFVFTKLVSEALDLIVDVLDEYEITREDGAMLDILDLLFLSTSGSAGSIDKKFLKQRIHESRKRFALHTKAVLPPVLTDPQTVYAFSVPYSKPNFITRGRVKGEVISVSGRSVRPEDVQGKIVVIRQADPGYDWIFGLAPAGLVTAFGGANSHMAIRAAEYGLPAVIGVGEKTFDRLHNKTILEIDCSSQRLVLLGDAH